MGAPPREGEANKELLKVLAGAVDVPKSSLSLSSGHKSKTKVVKVEGKTRKEIRDSLEKASN